METIQLTFTFEGAASPKAIAAKLRFQAGLLEGLDGKTASSVKNTSAPAALEKAAADFDEDFTEEQKSTIKMSNGRGSRSQVFSEDDGDDVEGSFDEGDDVEPDDEKMMDDLPVAPPPKKAKSKEVKYTKDNVNDACKARAKRASDAKTGRQEVLAILKKKFKVKSITDLEPEQYGQVIAALEA